MEVWDKVKIRGSSGVRLPQINAEDVEMTCSNKQIKVVRTLAPLEASKGKIAHNRVTSQDVTSKRVLIMQENPKDRARKNLMNDYGGSINYYLKFLEDLNRI